MTSRAHRDLLLASLLLAAVASFGCRRAAPEQAALPPPGASGEAQGAQPPEDASGPNGATTEEPRAVIPRRPHAPAAALLQAASGEWRVGLEPGAVDALDLALRELVPDFAVKDPARPWLDRQHVPVAIRVGQGSQGMEVVVVLDRHAWDEGRAQPVVQDELRLAWSAGAWRPVVLPEALAEDLRAARSTLEGDWKAGERMVAP